MLKFIQWRIIKNQWVFINNCQCGVSMSFLETVSTYIIKEVMCIISVFIPQNMFCTALVQNNGKTEVTNSMKCSLRSTHGTAESKRCDINKTCRHGTCHTSPWWKIWKRVVFLRLGNNKIVYWHGWLAEKTSLHIVTMNALSHIGCKGAPKYNFVTEHFHTWEHFYRTHNKILVHEAKKLHHKQW